jgi:CheY-like chemotaxis protein
MQILSPLSRSSEIISDPLPSTLLRAEFAECAPADPLAVTTATPPSPVVIQPSEADLPPVLVADDDEDDTFFIQRLIRKTGVKNPVRTFDDGSEVVNYLGARLSIGRHHIPHLLFLDLRMKGLGGFGFLEWARQQKELLALTIVVLSNSNEPADVERALELGAHRYLVKYPSVQTMSTIVHAVYPQTVF